MQVGTGFITRECQTVVEQVRRDCLARLIIVDKEMNETNPLSHLHSRQLCVEIGSTVRLEVVPTYSYPLAYSYHFQSARGLFLEESLPSHERFYHP